MTALGEFLERFYGPEEFFRTVHARVRHTKRTTPESSSPRKHRQIGRVRQRAVPNSESTEDLIFRGRLPDQVRVETTEENEGRLETTIEVVNRAASWRQNPDGTVETDWIIQKRRSADYALPTEFQRHFDRSLLRQCFAALTLEQTGTCQVAGRECIAIRAESIPGARLWPHWFSFIASDFEFAADVEHAVLLSIKCLSGGEVVEVHEVVEVTFDEPIDDAVFVYQPDENVTVQKARPVVERVTLEEAVARAPFVVLQPNVLPDSPPDSIDVMYHSPGPTQMEDYVTIFYRGGGLSNTLWMHQRSEPAEDWYETLEWEEILVEGQRMEISDPESEEGLQVLFFRREKTCVTIYSDLPRSELVKFAMSLRPVRGSEG